jgi:hypothetical protein
MQVYARNPKSQKKSENRQIREGGEYAQRADGETGRQRDKEPHRTYDLTHWPGRLAEVDEKIGPVMP